ncbi:hypothetical protein QL285_047560 [Trifolium repens]|jgi:hypothetical protein|nr:hypothetical protein QL285_047560 [Trifolium repens]
MNMLQNSPHAQALAFNNISLDFFNNFWAWLTVIFWRIRITKPELLPPSSDDITEADKPDSIPEVLEPCHDDNGVSDEDVVGITKGKIKFTSYFYEDVDINDDETLKKITWEDKEGRLGWWERWEKLLITRIGENENGWYTCQDLTVFSGNVVRFWDADGGSN